MKIFRLQSSGIFRLETPGQLAPAGWGLGLGFSAWELPFKIVRFKSVNWKVSVGIFRLGTLGNLRFGTFSLELALRNFRLETSTWKL